MQNFEVDILYMIIEVSEEFTQVRTFPYVRSEFYLWLLFVLERLPDDLSDHQLVGQQNPTIMCGNSSQCRVRPVSSKTTYPMGIIAAELYTGKDAVEQWGF